MNTQVIMFHVITYSQYLFVTFVLFCFFCRQNSLYSYRLFEFGCFTCLIDDS